jgi:hypothetical protein
MNYKEIRNSTKISVTPGIHLTRGGRPTDPTLQPPVSILGDDALQEAVEWNPRPRVGGGYA